MKKPPSQTQMSDPGQTQGGEPNYDDETADSVKANNGNDLISDAPNYIASNPRYWEYR